MTVTLLVIAFFAFCLQVKKLKLFETKKHKIERMKENKKKITDADENLMGATVLATMFVYAFIILWYITVGSMMGGIFIVIASLLAVSCIYSVIEGLKMLPNIETYEYKGERFYLGKILSLLSLFMTIAFILFLIF